MPGEVDRLQVKIESDAQQAFKNVDSLIGRLRELARTAGTAAYAFQRLGGGFSAMGRETKGLNSGFSEVGKQAKGMGNSLSFAEKQLAEMAVYTGATYREVARLRGGLQQYANGASAVKTTSDMASRGITSVGSAAKSAFSAIAKVGSAGFNFLGKTIGSVTKRLTGFFKSIIRIAKYRAIRAALRAITDGLRVGTENLYLWSQAYNTSFAPTMDRLSTSMLYLKNGFAAMFSPLIEYFAPYIESFVDRLVDAFNWVQRLFAQLTGKTTWNKAVKVQKKYKESTDSTAKSVKALRQELQLMDFDELNNITDNPDNGSPAAEAAKVEPDPTKMFTLEQTDLEPMEGTLWENIKKKLIGWLEEQGLWNENGFDWKRLGNIIGTWIHDLWQNFSKWWHDIDWKNDVFKPLADFLEGLLSGLFPEQYAKYKEAKDSEDLLKEVNTIYQESERDRSKFTTDRAWSDNLLDKYFLLRADQSKLTAAKGKVEDAFNNLIAGLGEDELNSLAELYKDWQMGNDKGMREFAQNGRFRAYANYLDEIALLEKQITTLEEEKNQAYRQYIGAEKIQQWNTIGGHKNTLFEIDWSRDDFKLNAFLDEFNAALKAGTIDDWLNDMVSNASDYIKGVFKDNNIGYAVSEYLDGVLDAGELRQKIVEAFSESNPTETWAESIRDNLDTIEESGALAGTTAGKWFGTSSREETMKNISETMSAAQSMLSNNPLTAILQIRTRLINTLNENGQGADGLPRDRSALGKVKDSLLPGGITNVWSNIKKVLGFADGGYPTVGTMFYAGEAGAEMVGNINGRTGVASGQEITGIGDAVWSTGNTTANILNEILIAVREKDLTISPSASLGKVVARSQRLYATQTG